MISRIAYFIATFGYTGLSPKMPGTVASFAAALLIGFAAPSNQTLLILIVISFLLGLWSCPYVEKMLGQKDPGRVVIDEVLGILITFLILPVSLNWFVVFLGFFFFRVFDITKFFPVNQAERLPGGYGVMLDDVVAGIYANLCLQVICRFIL